MNRTNEALKDDIDAPQPSDARGVLLSRNEITRNPPTAAFEGSRYWLIERNDEASSGLGEISGCLPLHFHTDGEHRLGILSGRLEIRVGPDARVVGPGDYVRIPKGVPHKLVCVSEESAWFVTFDFPPMDPSNFYWLEPAPKRVPGCPFCPTPGTEQP